MAGKGMYKRVTVSQWNASRNLAARTIQKAWKKKKQQSLRQVVKQVVSRQAETKSFLNTFTLAPIDDAVACCNLLYPITQGTQDNNIIGTKFYLKNIHIKGRVLNNVGSNNSTKLCRIVIFRTKKAITNTSTNAMSSGDLFRNSPVLAANGHVDLRRVKLLYDRRFTITENFNDQNVQKLFDINLKFDTTEYFESDGAGYLKDSNIYLAYTSEDGNLVANPTTCNFAYTVNFKDE